MSHILIQSMMTLILILGLVACMNVIGTELELEPSSTIPNELHRLSSYTVDPSATSESTPSSFIEHSTWIEDGLHGSQLDADAATQFLTHHMKANRAFAGQATDKSTRVGVECGDGTQRIYAFSVLKLSTCAVLLFPAGFDPSHVPSAAESSKSSAAMCPKCTLSSKAGASGLFIDKTECKLPRRYWVSSGDVMAKPFTPATQRHISRLLGEITTSLRVIKVSQASFACIDGRRPHGSVESLPWSSKSLHAFGGDFGEFLLGLQILHKHAHNMMYESTVESLFKRWIDQPSSTSTDPTNPPGRPYFYYHSDIETLSRIANELGYEIAHRNGSWQNPIEILKGEQPIEYHSPSGTSEVPEGSQLPFLDFTNPPLQIQELLLELLIKPENQGCVHLRSLMMYPKLYKIPVFLVQWALKAYYRLLWNKDVMSSADPTVPLYFKLKFVVSAGQHEERAWINVKMTRKCDAAGLAPVITTQPSSSTDPEKSWSEVDAKAAVFDRNPGEVSEVAPLTIEEDPSAAKSLKPDEVFMFHPQAVQHRRAALAGLVMEKYGTLAYESIMEEINVLAEEGQERTKKLLTKNIPEYNVRAI